MQKKLLFFAGIVLCLLMIGVAGLYWYQKPRTSLSNIKPAYTISANDLYNSFQQNEQKANHQFLEKVVQVKGVIDNVQVTDSTISCLLSADNPMGGINCSLSKNKMNKQMLPAKGNVIQVKGRCVGFLIDVNLVDAIIEK